MKKILVVIGTFLLLGLIMNLYTGTKKMATDGIEVNTTYLKDSKVLVAAMSIAGNIREEKTLDIQTFLKDNNTLTIKNEQTDGEMECIVRDSKGEKVFSEVMKGDAIRSFKSLSGEGSIKLVLNGGKQHAMVIINGDEPDFE
ncbi:hypothetical protein [Bacillus sp. mrc49]|uniref:hypothetical protein n=1 Tax=Bacillus sp. mrc49 TaxID=2054913 RepID=UPI000C274DD1|nr:hypothetical protein [Bacillus sp. mrc49]PJN88459.1 hypothetical protein CVN76_20515 [Bacillus sp. mrc49]